MKLTALMAALAAIHEEYGDIDARSETWVLGEMLETPNIRVKVVDAEPGKPGRGKVVEIVGQ